MTAARRPRGADAARAAIEADYPGWQVALNDLGRWYAAPELPLRIVPGGRECRPNLGADDAAGLRDVLDSWGARRAGGSG